MFLILVTSTIHLLRSPLHRGPALSLHLTHVIWRHDAFSVNPPPPCVTHLYIFFLRTWLECLEDRIMHPILKLFFYCFVLIFLPLPFHLFFPSWTLTLPSSVFPHPFFSPPPYSPPFPSFIPLLPLSSPFLPYTWKKERERERKETNNVKKRKKCSETWCADLFLPKTVLLETPLPLCSAAVNWKLIRDRCIGVPGVVLTVITVA